MTSRARAQTDTYVDPSTQSSTTTTTVTVAASVFVVLVYLALNVTGTVYYTKLKALPTLPPTVTKGLMDWNLASVILGWLLFPLLNLSSPITYAATVVK